MVKSVLCDYSCIIPSEIKNFFGRIWNKLFSGKLVRVSFAYLFRVQYNGLYLLVKDEQGRNTYHPVGGVYKYYPEKIDIAEEFGGEYDGLHGMTQDTENDLRLKIDKAKLTHFIEWFKKGESRENWENLSREFFEELIERGVLSENDFKTISYTYIGSHMTKSRNKELRMPQVHHFDIFDIHLTNPQKGQLKQLRKKQSLEYLFASDDDIEKGYVFFAGNRYRIAEPSEYILVKNGSKLEKEYALSRKITVPLHSNEP